MATTHSFRGDLDDETQAALDLIENLRVILATDGDDADTVQDMVDGETSLFDVLDCAIERMQAASDMSDALGLRVAKLQTRRRRLDQRVDGIRMVLASAMERLSTVNDAFKRIERPSATLSLRPVQPSAKVTDEALIPPEFWKPGDPKLDKSALTKALKDGRSVEGAYLSNGGVTVQMRTS